MPKTKQGDKARRLKWEARNPGLRKCIYCGEAKPIPDPTETLPNKVWHNTRKCMDCRNTDRRKRQAKRRKTDPEYRQSVRDKQREWVANNPEKVQGYQDARNEKYKTDPEYRDKVLTRRSESKKRRLAKETPKERRERLKKSRERYQVYRTDERLAERRAKRKASGEQGNYPRCVTRPDPTLFSS